MASFHVMDDWKPGMLVIKKINELHWRLLLQDAEKGGSGKIIRSKMHDLFVTLLNL